MCCAKYSRVAVVPGGFDVNIRSATICAELAGSVCSMINSTGWPVLSRTLPTTCCTGFPDSTTSPSGGLTPRFAPCTRRCADGCRERGPRASWRRPVPGPAGPAASAPARPSGRPSAPRRSRVARPPTPGCWTRRVFNTFYDSRRAAPGPAGRPQMIMSLIVRFTTRRALPLGWPTGRLSLRDSRTGRRVS